ncbi:MAG: hypothetical protein JXB04_10310 [Kiritimatiellae bacterium]|nr:hypothetical protein [Kiritimatiellia bacterium]
MQKPYALARLSSAVLFVLFVAGCATSDQKHFSQTRSSANVYVSPRQAAIRKVAIMPFKAETELIGASVSDLFVTEMLRAGRYELVERSQLARVLSESELALAGLSASDAASVGNMIGADGVIIGTVDQYGTVAYRGHAYPVVGITVRMIDSKSGGIVWSVDLADRAKDRTATLSQHAREVVHEMMSGLYRAW